MHRARMHKRQSPDASTVGAFSLTSTAATAATESALLVDSSATSVPSVSAPSLVTGTTIVITTGTASSSAAVSTAPVQSQGSSSSQHSIPIGTVVGACVGVFAVLSLILFLVLWTGQRSRRRAQTLTGKRGPTSSAAGGRNAIQENERRKSKRETWLRMDDKDALAEGSGAEKIAMRDAPAAAKGVGRSITMKTMKSSKTDKSYGAGLGLAKTFAPDSAPQLEFTDSELGHPRADFGRGAAGDPISWGGETIADDSFLSLKSGRGIGMDSEMSPSMVVTRQTPRATEHHHVWEEAELVSPDGDGDAYGGFEEQMRAPPMHAVAASAVSKNPFLTSKNPFADVHAVSVSTASSDDPPTPSAKEGRRDDRAMQSLLAALNISTDEANERLAAASQPSPSTATRQSGRSFSTYTSNYSDAPEGEEDIANLSPFPMPPTDTVHHDHRP